MQAPEFWNHAQGRQSAPLTRAMLGPVSWLYQAGAGMRTTLSKPYRPAAPVVCVGNITMGGAGKTPMTIAIMERLSEKGVAAHALTRGYGGRKHGPLLVDLDKHTYRDIGDEAMLLARAGPTWVAKNKSAGAKAAVLGGAEVIIMDDGFQNPTVFKDASLVIIDGEVGLGNGRIFPAGPMRESAKSALRRADAVILVGGDESDPVHTIWRKHLPVGVPILRATVMPRGPIPQGPVFAFAGIARPEKFFNALREAGAELKATTTFPDHHNFAESDLRELRETARRHNALMMTTEKDYMRIPKDLRRIIHTWPVGIELEDPGQLDGIVERAIDRAASRR